MTNRTSKQHMADVAAATLATLTRLMDDAQTLASQLEILGGCLREEDPGAMIPDPLLAAHATPWVLTNAQEAVRDIAATLPIRGIEYGADA
jgi:hypothetical protein